MDMDKHIDIVGYIWLALGILQALTGLLLWLVISGSGQLSGDPEAAWITGVVGSILGIVLLILALPELLGGWGLLRRQSWSRILIIVLSIITVFGFPIGTLIGGYSLWVLFNEEAKREFY